MVYQNFTVPFEKTLMKFVIDKDPMLEMLKCLCERLMFASQPATLSNIAVTGPVDVLISTLRLLQRFSKNVTRLLNQVGVTMAFANFIDTIGVHGFKEKRKPQFRVE